MADWSTSLSALDTLLHRDAHRDVSSLLCGIGEALALLESPAVEEPIEDVKPKAEVEVEVAVTKEDVKPVIKQQEDVDDISLGGILALRSPLYASRRAPSPQPQPKPPSRSLSPSLSLPASPRSSPETPGSQPPPGSSEVDQRDLDRRRRGEDRSPDTFPLADFDPLTPPLDRFPAVAVPSSLIDPDTSLPVFHGSFIRQRRQGQSPDGQSANESPDINNNRTLAMGKMMNKTYVNVLPQQPGYPWAGFFEDFWREEEEPTHGEGNTVSVFFEHGSWHQYGEYTTYKKDRYAITGRPSRRSRSSNAGTSSPSPSEAWDALLARGERWAIHFSIFVCTGFDAAKIATWVDQRATRHSFERKWAERKVARAAALAKVGTQSTDQQDPDDEEEDKEEEARPAKKIKRTRR